jgi:lipopolysaccharide transport system ATP-binding protein
LHLLANLSMYTFCKFSKYKQSIYLYMKRNLPTFLSKSFSKRSELPAGSIFVDAVSKRFRKHTVAKRSYTTVKSTLLSRVFSKKFPKNNFITALDNLTLNLSPGSAVGIIGRNGSGKSTLLKLIAGIYRPTTGNINVEGRVSALIELGAGFHPDFTGRENVYLGGVMYGLTRQEIDNLFDDIVNYAGLEDFIDDPVRTYSSGMYMRLGFSLAVHTDPDILLVDEVLAVGDANFVHRCHETISELKRKGKTLVLVTHDLDSVARWCEEAIWLDHGRVAARGEPRVVIDSYLAAVNEQEESQLASENKALTKKIDETELNLNQTENQTRWGNEDVVVNDVKMLGKDGVEKWLFASDESITIEVNYQINAKINDLVFGIGILRADGLCVHGTNTDIDDVLVPIPDFNVLSIETYKTGGRERFLNPLFGTYRFYIEKSGLLDGSYFLDIAAHKSDGTPYDYHHRKHKFSIRNPLRYHGIYNPRHEWEFNPEYKVAQIAKGADAVND